METLFARPQCQNIFSSVFSDANSAAPKVRKRTRSSATFRLDHVIATLRSDSRNALGIARENQAFGPTSDKLINFCFYYPNCPAISLINIPLEQSRRNHIAACTRLDSWRYISTLREHFGCPKLEKIFATVIDKLVTDFVDWSYAGAYDDTVLPHLRFWVDNILLPYVSGYLNLLNNRRAPPAVFDQSQIQKWHDLCFGRLASLRIAELFDVVVDWDASAAVIDDLKLYTTNPATRSYLTTEFADVLVTRLLHPGASTIEIVTVYISLIRAFRRLDPKGVLLERVARKLRRYLHDREDTIKVVVTGLLSDPSTTESVADSDVLHELAHELHHQAAPASKTSDADLDFNNMEWLPDPIDAAPDYLKSKSTDVIGSLITLFDSKDVFIRELQATLADRLLKNKADFDQEISVIEHLKIRFGDSALQDCEVMLRDVLDSRKVDHVIRQDQGMDQSDQQSNKDDAQLHTKILSRLFWPPLQEQTFRVPLTIQHQQTLYEKGFENLKQSRRLTWLNSIGQVEVELEFEDRVFHDEVLPWQASVIYAFQADEATAPSRTVPDLASELEMTPALVRSACMYWSSKRVLHEGPRDTFTVLETLPAGTDQIANADPGRQDADAAAAEIAAAQAARQAEEAERKQKMGLYHQFIISMLTNQGAMPLPRIAMMLGIVVPGGFPFGNEELKEFLGGMVKEGVLQLGPGGNYKVAT